MCLGIEMTNSILPLVVAGVDICVDDTIVDGVIVDGVEIIEVGSWCCWLPLSCNMRRRKDSFQI